LSLAEHFLVSVEGCLELLAFLQRNLEARRWLSASLDPDNLTVLEVDEAAHHRGQSNDVAVAKRVQLYDFVKVFREETFDEVQVERVIATTDGHRRSLPRLSVGILGLALTWLASWLLLGLLLLRLGISGLLLGVGGLAVTRLG
jgi:hypothetical protein